LDLPLVSSCPPSSHDKHKTKNNKTDLPTLSFTATLNKVSYEDNQIQVTIRRLLTSFWVDLTAVNIRVTSGNVYLSGTLRRMTHDHREMLPGQLKRLDLSIRSLRDVRAVYYNFDNLSYSVYGTWLSVTKEAIELNESDLPPEAPKTDS